MKYCSKCGKEKSLDNFGAYRDDPHGRSICKPCNNSYTHTEDRSNRIFADKALTYYNKINKLFDNVPSGMTARLGKDLETKLELSDELNCYVTDKKVTKKPSESKSDTFCITYIDPVGNLMNINNIAIVSYQTKLSRESNKYFDIHINVVKPILRQKILKEPLPGIKEKNKNNAKSSIKMDIENPKPISKDIKKLVKKHKENSESMEDSESESEQNLETKKLKYNVITRIKNELNITEKDIYKLLVDQNYRCGLSGKSFDLNSDDSDTSLGYILKAKLYVFVHYKYEILCKKINKQLENNYEKENPIEFSSFKKYFYVFSPSDTDILPKTRLELLYVKCKDADVKNGHDTEIDIFDIARMLYGTRYKCEFCKSELICGYKCEKVNQPTIVLLDKSECFSTENAAVSCVKCAEGRTHLK